MSLGTMPTRVVASRRVSGIGVVPSRSVVALSSCPRKPGEETTISEPAQSGGPACSVITGGDGGGGGGGARAAGPAPSAQAATTSRRTARRRKGIGGLGRARGRDDL